MFAIYIQLDGGGSYKLCQAVDMLALWSLVETLLGDGTRGVDQLSIVRYEPGAEPTIYRPPVP